MVTELLSNKRVDWALLLITVIFFLVFTATGCVAVYLPALQNDGESIERSATFESVSGYLIIPVVLTATLLSMIRLWNWKGRPLEMEVTRSAGSNVTRSELLELEQKLKNKNLLSSERNSDDSPAEDIPWNESKPMFEPSKHKSRLFLSLSLAFLSSISVSVSIWLGFRSFAQTFRLAAMALNRSLPDPTCENNYNADQQFTWWVLSILFCLPCLNYVLYVMSRGTSYYESLIQIFYPFITKKREALICQNREARGVRIKKFWLLADGFVMCRQRLEDQLQNCKFTPSAIQLVYRVWHWSLWIIAWILVAVFVEEFVTRGIVDAQWFIGWSPRGWVCFISSNWVSPCSGAIKATSQSNISTTDTLYCFRFRKVTFSADSDLKEAFGFSFAIYLFVVRALGITFKVLASFCLSIKESVCKTSVSKRRSTWYGAALVSCLAWSYVSWVVVSFHNWPQLYLNSRWLYGLALLTGTLIGTVIPFLVGCCEVGLTEDDIKWQYFKLPEQLFEDSFAQDVM